jgi:RNA polymerase sigma factor (sigma-70 family)
MTVPWAVMRSNSSTFSGGNTWVDPVLSLLLWIWLAAVLARAQAAFMMGQEKNHAPGVVGQPLFATTHWSVVLAATDQVAPEAPAALESLCRTYWYPLYAYVRHRGHRPEDAQDLTQEFFHRLLRRNSLSQVDPRKGKFRSFLLASINHFLANEWDRARTIKRGGQITFVPFEEAPAEDRYQTHLAVGGSPEQIYERAWAIALLERVLGRLRQETAAAGQEKRFEELKVILMGQKPSLSYAELAVKLGTTEPALKMAVQRLRRRYGELLREEITQTVAAPSDAEAELRHLRAVLSSRS